MARRLLNFRAMDSDIDGFRHFVTWESEVRYGLFWRKTRIMSGAAYGGSTVWYFSPSGRRCPTDLEMVIADEFARARIVRGK